MKKTMLLLQKISLKELKNIPLKEASKKRVSEFLEILKSDFGKFPPPKTGFNAVFTATVLLESLYNIKQETNFGVFQGNPRAKIRRIYELIGARGAHAIRLFELLSAIDTIIELTPKMMHIEILRNGIEYRLKDIQDEIGGGNSVKITQSFIELGAFLQRQLPGYHTEDIKIDLNKIGDEGYKLHDKLRKLNKKDFGNLYYFRVLSAIVERERVKSTILKISPHKMDALAKGLGIFKFCMGERQINMKLIEEKDEELVEKDIINAKKNIYESNYEVSLAHESTTTIVDQGIHNLAKNIQMRLNFLGRVIQLEQQKHPELEARYTSKIELIENIGELRGHLFEKASEKLKAACKNYMAVKRLEDALKASGTPKKRLQDFRKMFFSKDTSSILASDIGANFMFLIKNRKKYISSSKFQKIGIKQLESLKQQGFISEL